MSLENCAIFFLITSFSSVKQPVLQENANCEEIFRISRKSIEYKIYIT